MFRTAGVASPSDDVLVTYADLDVLIDACGLSPQEGKIVHWLMEGYGLSDIANHMKIRTSVAEEAYSSAVGKIIAENTRRWRKVYARKESVAEI